jgi:hypothetical protein
MAAAVAHGEGSAMRPESLIALAERLKAEARRVRKSEPAFAADLRYAVFCCRRLAALAVADELAGEHDSGRRRELVEEIGGLLREGGGGPCPASSGTGT